MCGNHRSDFSKQSINFDEHTSKQHDQWNYVYYIYYMKAKGEDELSGLEYFAWSKFMEQKTEWIPVGETLYLKGE